MQNPIAFEKVGYVYVLKSLKDDNRYVGSTNNLDRRLKEHQAGLVKSTYPYMIWNAIVVKFFNERRTKWIV